jgi:hypothetical protein
MQRLGFYNLLPEEQDFERVLSHQHLLLCQSSSQLIIHALFCFAVPGLVLGLDISSPSRTASARTLAAGMSSMSPAVKRCKTKTG